MASASSKPSLHRQDVSVATSTQPEGKVPGAVGNLGPPGLLRCLIFSSCDQRMAALQAAAEREAWEVIVSGNALEFVRQVFREQVPLTLVDLPGSQQAEYEKIRDLAAKASSIGDSLLILCGTNDDPAEEMWARQLGVWSYLPEVTKPKDLDWVFAEARKAVAQSASSDLHIPVVQQSTSARNGATVAGKQPQNNGNRFAYRYTGGEKSSFPRESRRESHVQQKKKR